MIKKSIKGISCNISFIEIRTFIVTYNKSHFCAIATYHLKYFEIKLKAFRLKFSIVKKPVMFEIKKPPVKSRNLQ